MRDQELDREAGETHGRKEVAEEPGQLSARVVYARLRFEEEVRQEQRGGGDDGQAAEEANLRQAEQIAEVACASGSHGRDGFGRAQCLGWWQHPARGETERHHQGSHDEDQVLGAELVREGAHHHAEDHARQRPGGPNDHEQPLALSRIEHRDGDRPEEQDGQPAEQVAEEIDGDDHAVPRGEERHAEHERQHDQSAGGSGEESGGRDPRYEPTDRECDADEERRRRDVHVGKRGCVEPREEHGAAGGSGHDGGPHHAREGRDRAQQPGPFVGKDLWEQRSEHQSPRVGGVPRGSRPTTAR